MLPDVNETERVPPEQTAEFTRLRWFHRRNPFVAADRRYGGSLTLALSAARAIRA